MKVIDKYKKVNVLIYDDEKLIYHNGVLASFNTTPNVIEYSYLTNTNAKSICTGVDISYTLSNYEEHEIIKLDDTLMKRIAKFNKEQEIAKLDEKIKSKKKTIKELENILEDREKRVEKIKQYIANIYDIDIVDEDEEDYYDD